MTFQPIESLNSDELSTKLVELEKDVSEKMANLNIVEIERAEIEKALIELRRKHYNEKAEMEDRLNRIKEALREGKYLLSKLRSIKEITERYYWKSRNK